jgi:glycogen debranching enzyme
MDSTFTSGNLPESMLWDLGFETIKELEVDQGILASGKEEIFGCIFGRDSLITSLKLLRVYENTKDPYFLTLVRKVLKNLAVLQGTHINIESGEEPGKCIHEYRPNNHEHLTQSLDNPWYVYPDNVMRNYDSIDSTPLFLIALYRYYKASNDTHFIAETLPNVHAGLTWLLTYADKNGDGFIDYGLHPDRKHGGLATQSWMDSVESVFHEDGSPVSYPIAPVEAQSYAFLALRLWSSYFADSAEDVSKSLRLRADLLKQRFNEVFITADTQGLILATGVDGNGKLLTSARSSMGHCLWASLETNRDGVRESILNDEYIPQVVSRLLSTDMFAPKAGIRTLSSLSRGYASNSYHNGSIWPHDTSIIAEGFDIFGYTQEASKIREALMYALMHFNSPVELFVYDEDYAEYCGPTGQHACKKQAWSAATLLKDMSFVKQS